MLSMKFFGKFRYMIASVLLFLGVFIGISNLGINQVSAESILPYVGPGITFEQQFPNAQTASVIARQFNKVPSDEMTSADIAITSLDLYSTNLTNIDGIDIFSNLTYLDISSNQIVNLPEGLFALTKLQYLDASRNGLVVIPESIGNLFGLIYLDIGVNSLIRLPERIGDLTALKTFEVYNNQLTSLPVSMVNLVNMTYFNAQSNFLPSDYDLLLSELLGITVMRNPQESVLLSQPTSIKISSQQDMDTIDFTTFIRSRYTQRLSEGHVYQFENYLDESMQAVDINDYLQNGVVKKSGVVYAQVRVTGEGLFPNSSDNALTTESVQLNFETNQFGLSFDLNGGSGIVPATQFLTEGELAASVETPTREGNRFLGWNTAQDGSGIDWDFTATAMPANDVTLYAQWTENFNLAYFYHLNFDLNGGDGVVPETQKIEKDQLAIKPTDPSRKNYIFKGWNTAKNGNGLIWDFATTAMSANDVTLYAQWEENSDPKKPVNPTNPLTPVKPVTPEDNHSTSKSDEKVKSESSGTRTVLPKTGEKYLSPLLGVFVFLLGSVLLFLNKKHWMR
ncbi:InlB B-repeat-containing protein [Enterococcus rivorum]|uniref:Gram-positive cocci surface proteins LPxTG domain-containing protein n=1 Tax=Enterococcus rivorum TaxID=762845 RepID=A0A1E5KXQ9_9ENTE|nr:InlB B-repeat-containing protein [Enterococcus rivorum]MBP2099770.1 putative repeat protein (TIGR02543 family) [Enterococcus rivorum]OEH82646.1 hypothetical protein BCR26_12505 [Enterococcus rivorum]